MILDATKRAEQRALLEQELEAVGIRLNREPPCVASFQMSYWSDNSKQYLSKDKESWRSEDQLSSTSEKS